MILELSFCIGLPSCKQDSTKTVSWLAHLPFLNILTIHGIFFFTRNCPASNLPIFHRISSHSGITFPAGRKLLLSVKFWLYSQWSRNNSTYWLGLLAYEYPVSPGSFMPFAFIPIKFISSLLLLESIKKYDFFSILIKWFNQISCKISDIR